MDREPCFRSGIWFEGTATAILQFNDHRTYSYPNIDSNRWLELKNQCRGCTFNEHWRWRWEHEEIDGYPGDPSDADDCFLEIEGLFDEPNTEPQPEPPCKDILAQSYRYETYSGFLAQASLTCKVVKWEGVILYTLCELPITERTFGSLPDECSGYRNRELPREFTAPASSPIFKTGTYKHESLYLAYSGQPTAFDTTGWASYDGGRLLVKRTCPNKTWEMARQEAIDYCESNCSADGSRILTLSLNGPTGPVDCTHGGPGGVPGNMYLTHCDAVVLKEGEPYP